MKRTPLKRTSYLNRKTPLNWRRRKPRRQSRERNREFMMWVRRQPCAVRGEMPFVARMEDLCDGHVQADHVGRRGLSQKSDDVECVPLCEKHHTQRSSFHGFFATWDQEQMRAWLEKQIAFYQAEYKRHLERMRRWG